MQRLWLISLLSLVGLLACVPSPVKKTDAGNIAIMAGDGTAGASVNPTGDAGSNGTGSGGASGGTAGDPSGAAGAGDPDDAGAAGATGSAGASEAGATGTGGASVTPTGSAGASGGSAGKSGGSAGAAAGGADGGADAHEAGTTTPDAPVITDPCDHRTWTFTPSVVCTTVCVAMADGQKLPANAIDGDTTTRYTTGITQGSKGPEVAILSFTQNVTLTGLNLFTKGGDGPVAYLVESSLDGANFSFFMPSAAGPGSDNLTVTFPAATKLRALRITQTGVKKTNWWSIHELTVKGCVATP
jgi:F5/8 type C domain